MDRLECRRLLAFVAVFSNGTLTVTSGDAVNDDIVIDDANTNGIIDVNGSDVAGATLGAVDLIVFSNVDGTGKDTVTIDQGNDVTAFDTIPVRMVAGVSGDSFHTANVAAAGATLLGGAGNDIMISGPGNDEIRVGAGANNLMADAGGNNLIDFSEQEGPLDIFVGTGRNTVLGSAFNDTIFGTSTGNSRFFGNAGNDTITSGSGQDLLVGGDGDDNLTGGGGADAVFGGAGNDILVWNPGDGSDLLEGGDGTADVMLFTGSAADEQFTLNANGSRLEFLRNVGNIRMDVGGVEEVHLNALGGADTMIMSPLGGTGVNLVRADLGPGAVDTVVVNGSAGADFLAANSVGASVQITGAGALLELVGATGDALQINGLAGDDTLTVANAVSALLSAVTLTGGGGDDLLFGDGTLVGGLGNDRLVGGPGDNLLMGGDGNDQLFGLGGNDSLIGGNGNDVLRGGAGHDVLIGGDGIDQLFGDAGFDILVSDLLDSILDVGPDGGQIL